MKRSKLGWVLALVAAMAGSAWADPAPLRSTGDSRSADELVRLAEEPRLTPFAAPIRLSLPSLAEAEAPRSDEFPLRLEAARPDRLELRFEVHAALVFTVGADLSGGLPRLDAIDGETYWAPGLELRLTPDLALYLEDFQPAGSILGDEEAGVPERTWDGHQVACGLVVRRGRWELRAAGVLYALSPTRRREALGARLALACRF